MGKYWYVFGMSMLPLVELRGSVILGCGLGLELIPVYLISVIGNMIPVPFILLFIRKIIAWMSTSSVAFFHKVGTFLTEKAQKHSQAVLKYAVFGLFVFVAIPLPGTGAWTGALVAALFDIPPKRSIPSILGGVLVAGLIMSLASYGLVSGLSFLVN